MGGEDGSGPGQQAFEGVRAVPGEVHLVGDLLEGGLHPVAEPGDQALERGGHGLSLGPGGRDDHVDPGAGHLGGEPAAGEALVQQQRVDGGGVAGDQAGADLAFVDGGGHDRPGADDAPAQVGADGQAEAVEPFGVRAVPAEPGGQVVVGAGSLIGAADPEGCLTGSAEVSICWTGLAGTARPGRRGAAEGAPQPAGAPVDLRLVRQVREQVRPVAADLGQEAVLAAAAEQAPDHGDREQFGVGAGRGGTGRRGIDRTPL